MLAVYTSMKNKSHSTLLFKLLIKVQKSEPLLQKWSYLSAQWANFAQIFWSCSWDMFLKDPILIKKSHVLQDSIYMTWRTGGFLKGS